MAPLLDVESDFRMHSMDANAAMVISAVMALAIGVSLIATVIVCGCCGKKEAPAGGDIYYGTDPGRPDYCPDCAAAEEYGDQPTVIDAATQMSASKAGGPSLHRFTHRIGPFGGGVLPPSEGGYDENDPKTKNAAWAKAKGLFKDSETQQTTAPTVPTILTAKSEGLVTAKSPNVYQSLTGGGPENVSGKKGGPPPSESQMNKAAANPNYQTLFGAKSDVFGGGKKVPAGTMIGTKSATNPNYQTLFGAKSDVFAKGGKGKSLVRPPEQSGGYRS